MSVFDWLEGVPLPNGASPYDVVEIRYKNNRKAYVRSPQAVTAHVGDVVVIDLQPGHDVGVVSLTGELVKSQFVSLPQGVDLLHVAFRWVNCLLVRELPLPCLLRLSR